MRNLQVIRELMVKQPTTFCYSWWDKNILFLFNFVLRVLLTAVRNKLHKDWKKSEAVFMLRWDCCLPAKYEDIEIQKRLLAQIQKFSK